VPSSWASPGRRKLDIDKEKELLLPEGLIPFPHPPDGMGPHRQCVSPLPCFSIYSSKKRFATTRSLNKYHSQRGSVNVFTTAAPFWGRESP